MCAEDKTLSRDLDKLQSTVAAWRKEMQRWGFVTPPLKEAIDFLSEEAGEVAGAKPRQDSKYIRRSQKSVRELKELMDWLMMALTCLEVGTFYAPMNDLAGAGSDTKYRQSVVDLIKSDVGLPLSSVLMLVSGQANAALAVGADWKYWVNLGLKTLMFDLQETGHDVRALLVESLSEREKNVIRNQQQPPDDEPVVTTAQGHRLWRGCQVAYVPDEAGGDPNHELSEWGFVTSIRVERETVIWVRFWNMRTYWSTKAFVLRTPSNSESCYPNFIVPYVSVPQDVVDSTMANLQG